MTEQQQRVDNSNEMFWGSSIDLLATVLGCILPPPGRLTGSVSHLFLLDPQCLACLPTTQQAVGGWGVGRKEGLVSLRHLLLRALSPVCSEDRHFLMS